MNFEKVKALMDNSVEKHGIPGSDIIVTHNGKEVYRYWNGTRDDKRCIPVTGDELYFLYSATKVITCTAVMQLVEKGKLALEDKVADYIPEYGDLWVKTEGGKKKAEQPMTLKHLLTMTSGLNYNIQTESILKQKENNPNSSTLEMVRAFAKEPLNFEPGTHYCYGLSHDVLAAIVEIVSEQSYGEYLKKHIFDICSMEHTGFQRNEAIENRISSQFIWDESSQSIKSMEKVNNFVLTPVYQSGGAGLISSVADYSKFATEMANGNRLLKRETMNQMRMNQLKGQAFLDFQKSRPGYVYGLGVRMECEGKFVAKRGFGWDGAAGAHVLIDPDNHIAIFYITHVKNYIHYIQNKLHPALRDAIYEELWNVKVRKMIHL